MRDTTYKYGRCLAASCIVKITPPADMYHRMWGAALHERAEAYTNHWNVTSCGQSCQLRRLSAYPLS